MTLTPNAMGPILKNRDCFKYRYWKVMQKDWVLFSLLSLFYVHTGVAEQIITIFVHGIADSHKQAEPFARTINNVHSFDFECSTERFWRMKPHCCSLGQDDELEQLYNEWIKLNDMYPHADGFIFIGISRGASAIINFLARYQPDKIRAVILESPFDMIENVVKHKAKLWHMRPTLLKKCIPLIFRKFSFDGIQPLKVIDDIKDDIPMLFVTVEGDHMVPLVCTQNLIGKRKMQQHQNLYHLHLNKGRHGKLLLGPAFDQYTEIIHAFFAHHGLPHLPTYAQRGELPFKQLAYSKPISLKNAASVGSRLKKFRNKLLGSALPPRPITS